MPHTTHRSLGPRAILRKIPNTPGTLSVRTLDYMYRYKTVAPVAYQVILEPGTGFVSLNPPEIILV